MIDSVLEGQRKRLAVVHLSQLPPWLFQGQTSSLEIATYFRNLFETHPHHPGESGKGLVLPPATELSRFFGTNVLDVVEALRILEQSGLCYKTPGLNGLITLWEREWSEAALA